MPDVSAKPGQLPASGVDPIPAWRSWSRKLVTFRTISQRGRRGLIGSDEYVGGMAQLQSGAARTDDMFRKTESFWAMENLSYAFLKNSPPGSSLRDRRLPLEVRPIAHCGMGAGAAELGLFEPARTGEVIDGFSDSDYRFFAYETIGAMFSVYERDSFGMATRMFDRLGVLKIAQIRTPDARTMLGGFPNDIRNLVSHGYGRMVYFKNHDIGRATRAAARLADFDPESAVQGIAFAYAMVNSREVATTLEAGGGLGDPRFVRAFRRGLVYAVMFWEWMSPGTLELIARRMRKPSPVVERARELTARDRAVGVLRPFGVGDAELD